MARNLRSKKEETVAPVEVEVAVETAEKVEEKALEGIDNAITKGKGKVEVKPQAKKETQARIKTSRRVRTYIGDRYWNFEAGVIYTVPQNVKDILKNAGYLEAI